MRFRVFIVLSIAIALALGGYSFARVEHSIHQQTIELAQERLNACKFKLYDLAVGSEGKAAHLAPGPQHNVHEAQIIAGALNVVNTIPSAKECIPVIKKAIKHQLGPQGLTPKLEHELIKLAVESNTDSNTPLPDNTTSKQHSSTHKHGSGHKGHKKGGKPTTTTPAIPPIIVTTTTPTPSIPKPSKPTTPKGKGPPVTVPPVKTPSGKTPPIETPPVTTPPIKVPPITVPSIEVPPVHIPPIEVPPIKINLEEPLCKVPVVKLVTCPKK